MKRIFDLRFLISDWRDARVMSMLLALCILFGCKPKSPPKAEAPDAAPGVVTPAPKADPPAPQKPVGARLEFAGVLGNSGVHGADLVRMGYPRRAGGIALDDAGVLFAAAGDRILALSPDGKLLWTIPLPREGWGLCGHQFALDKDHLYFLAGVNPIDGALQHGRWGGPDPNVCRVRRVPGAQPEVIIEKRALPWESTQRPPLPPEICLMDCRPLGRVFLGYSPKTGLWRLSEINAQARKLELRFEKQINAAYANVDENGYVYLSGDGQIHKFDLQGTAVPGFQPAPVPQLPRAPAPGPGRLILTKGALWESAHQGFVGRFTRDLKPFPGALAQSDLALWNVSQIADAPDDAYYLHSLTGLYKARIEDDRIALLGRLGSLPLVRTLVVTPQGYVGVGNDTWGFLAWFDFDDPRADQPPVSMSGYGPCSQGFAENDGVVAFGFQPPTESWTRWTNELKTRPRDVRLCSYPPEKGGDMWGITANKPGRSRELVTAVTAVGGQLFTLDEKGDLYASPRGDPAKFQQVIGLGVEGVVTSLAPLGRDHILVSVNDTLVCYKVVGSGAIDRGWTLRQFTPESDGVFGKKLYVATSDGVLVVSDRDRHRVLLFAFGKGPETEPVFLAQFGETDVAGASALQLALPGLVSIADGKAAVYDDGNQRVVRLRVR